MFSKTHVRPSGSLLGLIVGLTVVPLAILTWLGWRLLEQDRALEAQQVRQRVERSADLLVSSLQQSLVASEQRLVSEERSWPDGAVAVTLAADRITVSPPKRLAFFPVVATLQEPPSAPFAHGEDLEFRLRDSAAAAVVYRDLSMSSNAAIRAGAWLRLGRVLRQESDLENALNVYGQLSGIDTVAIDGVPAGLIGQYARCRALEDSKQDPELRQCGLRLQHDVVTGRWQLTQPVFELYAADAFRWSGIAFQVPPDQLTLAEAVAALWSRWVASPAAFQGSAGRESLPIDGGTAAVLWQRSGETVHALIATSGYAVSEWFNPLIAIAREQNVAFEIRDASSKRFGVVEGSGSTATRNAFDAGLPWTVVAGNLEPPIERTAFVRRRRLLMLGFLLLVSLTLVASYSIVRAVGREVAVARLQSDFVAAVSHEFRTPLTALRQFTDMLREQRGLDDQRRLVAYEAQARATDRLARLVESLLEFRSMEEGAHRYQFEPRDASKFVRRVVDEFRPQAINVGHDVHFHGNGAAPINVDDEALSRAVWNLLDNAVKYSAAPSAVDVSVAERDGTVRIAVRDHGIGVPDRERDAVFSKFFRGEQARSAGIKGTGIGLALVTHIVTAHGGRIELDSAQGQGSTFTIVLPTASHQST